MGFMEIDEKIRKHPGVWIWIAFTVIVIILFLTFVFLLAFPVWQVSHYNINNATEQATLENLYRTTLVQIASTFAQIFGGIAIFIGIYFAWKNVTIAQDGQITERFTRAIDQLGNSREEIRVGGIYALERISHESKKDFWPIMEILTAYVRMNSKLGKPTYMHDGKEFHTLVPLNKMSLDVQAILTVVGRSKYFFNAGEFTDIDLHRTSLREANLRRSNFQGANFEGADLDKANFEGADLVKTNLKGTSFEGANLKRTNLEGADFGKAASFFDGSNSDETILWEANLKGANLKGANLGRAHNLSVDQLSKVKTLYNAKLDEGLEAELRAKGYSHLIDDEPKDEP
jgi:hypothetical protein